jgi:hypothetical protein
MSSMRVSSYQFRRHSYRIHGVRLTKSARRLFYQTKINLPENDRQQYHQFIITGLVETVKDCDFGRRQGVWVTRRGILLFNASVLIRLNFSFFAGWY